MATDSNIPLQVRQPAFSLNPLMEALQFKQDSRQRAQNLQAGDLNQRIAQGEFDQNMAQGDLNRRISQAKLDEFENERNKQDAIKKIVQSNIKLGPDGDKKIDKRGFVQGLYSAGMAEEAMTFSQKFQKEATEKRDAFLSEKAAELKARGEIVKQNAPYLQALADPKERSKLLKSQFKEWRLDASYIPDEVSDDFLESLKRSADIAESYGREPTLIQYDDGTVSGLQFGSQGGFTESPLPSGSKVYIDPTKTPFYRGQVKTAEAEGSLAGSGEVPLTVFQKKVDEAFAPEYQAWITGGKADAQKGVTQLKEVSTALSNAIRDKRSLTGPAISLVPDLVKSLGVPEAISTREMVEEVVQRNLRLILGAQFTEAEGERLISRAFNPKLSEAENLKRVKRLLTQMESALKAKDEAVSYASKNGTLKGFDVSKLVASVSQFDLEDKGAKPASKAPLTKTKATKFKPLDKMSEQEIDAELKALEGGK